MKGNRKTQFAVATLAVAVAALAVVAALMLGLWYFTRPQAQEGAKAVVVEVVHGDESAKEFTYHTDLEYLGELLLAEKLVEGEEGAFGLFITTVDGETAQDSLRQWWCITKDGEQTETGADTVPIADGDHFELTMSTY